ncbi:hypothetical protein [Pseudomonas sp. K2I15]|uniref:hypothetical protein n=1 Tax=Pseudomonas sp. K2I15 TaxID=2013577 RepID=UPI00113047E6|nr:hypothetical protein [Pseudomonas sp. K2I15]
MKRFRLLICPFLALMFSSTIYAADFNNALIFPISPSAPSSVGVLHASQYTVSVGHDGTTQSAQSHFAELGAQLKSIDQKLTDNWLKTYSPFLVAIILSVISAFLTLYVQSKQFKHNEQSQDRKSGFEAMSKMLEYRHKQANEFYGPLLILIRQSYNLSRQLYSLLLNESPSSFYYLTDPARDGRESLYIRSQNGDRPFKLISDINLLAEHYQNCLPYVKLILDTGEKISDLIEQKSGFADPANEPLMACFAEYLAHRLALTDAYNQATTSGKATPARVHDAAYPWKLEQLVSSDYRTITAEITNWPTTINQLINGKTP